MHRRKTSSSSVDLTILLRNNSNVVPEVVEPGRQASSRSLRSCGSSNPSLKRQGTNDSIQSLGKSSNRSARSYRRTESNNSLSSLMKQGSFVVPRVEEPTSNLNSNLRRNVSDLSLNSLAAKHEGKTIHNDSQKSFGRSAHSHHGSCNSLSSLCRSRNNNTGRTTEEGSCRNAICRSEKQPTNYDQFHNLDSSDDSPAGSPLPRTDTLESRRPEEEITIGEGEITFDVTFDTGGAEDVEEEVEDENDRDFVAPRDSVYLSLQEMTAEAAAVMDSSSCWSSTGGPRSRTTALDRNPKRTEMEVSPGVYLPFRDAKETWQAVARGCTIRCCCLECGIDLVAIQDCECVVCPDCQMLNPVFDRPDGLKTVPHGIGLGLKAEVVAQKLAAKRKK